jgi:hypothetical protein
MYKVTFAYPHFARTVTRYYDEWEDLEEEVSLAFEMAAMRYENEPFVCPEYEDGKTVEAYGLRVTIAKQG